MNLAIDIIEPCGFPFGDAALRRSGMDYLPKADLRRHSSWRAFLEQRSGRLILATTKSVKAYTSVTYGEDDTLLLGRESAGVPDEVAATCEEKVCIPMADGMRSLNVALAGGMIVGEMLRQVRYSTQQ